MLCRCNEQEDVHLSCFKTSVKEDNTETLTPNFYIVLKLGHTILFFYGNDERRERERRNRVSKGENGEKFV